MVADRSIWPPLHSSDDRATRAMPAAAETRLTTWTAVAHALRRPYPVTIPMVALMLLVPWYLFIANRAARVTAYAPELPWDRALPLLPTWAVIYGALYMFLIVLPVFVVREEEHIRRTFWAYLAVWLTAYVVFLVYPTVAPRPPEVTGEGFAVWGLRFLYDGDPPYNCFPSLHVAQSFVSALTCDRVHRRVGAAALLCAALVAVSTLFTKQHYIADAIGGILLAVGAYVLILRRYPRERVPEIDRRLAPVLSLGVITAIGLGVVGFWFVYLLVW
jgi:membrane-associated phospholipid phosphatase